MDSPFNIGFKKYFSWVPAYIVSEIMLVKSVPGIFSVVNNFRHSLLSAS